MRILIYDEMHPSIVPLLQALGCEPDYQPQITGAGLAEVIADYDGLIGRSKVRLDATLLQRAPRLKLIGRSGAGLDDIDLEQAERQGITIVNAPEGNRDAVGEHTVALLLNLLHHVTRAHNQIALGQWIREPNRGTSLQGKTVGIIGYGNMGQAFAKRLAGFGCRVLAYDKYATWEVSAERPAAPATLEQLQAEAHILSLHVPLTTETRYMVDATFLAGFAQPIYLLNTARGKVVRLTDLADALESGRVLAAGLDVLENEKLPTYTPDEHALLQRLLATERVLLTPHIAGWTHESYHQLNVVLSQKIGEWLRGG